MKTRVVTKVVGLGILALSACAGEDASEAGFAAQLTREQPRAEPEGGPSARAHSPAKPHGHGRKKPLRPNRPRPQAPEPEPEPGPEPEPDPEPELGCLFGETYREFRSSAGFELSVHEIIDASHIATLPEATAAQLLCAVQVAYAAASDVTSALDSVDEGLVNRSVLRELDGARTFVLYEYGAGDNSYGAAFEGDGLSPVVEIQDGDLFACQVLGQARGAREGSACGGGYGDNCDSGLRCIDFDEDEGRGVCAP